MGVSTDAIIAFGISLPEDLPEAFKETVGEDLDFESYIYGLSGIQRPSLSYENTQVWEAYWNSRREALAKFPLELITHCSGEYPMYILAARGTRIEARRGYPEEFNPKNLVVAEDKVDALRTFCEQCDIPCQNPGWLLFSYWG